MTKRQQHYDWVPHVCANCGGYIKDVVGNACPSGANHRWEKVQAATEKKPPKSVVLSGTCQVWKDKSGVVTHVTINTPFETVDVREPLLRFDGKQVSLTVVEVNDDQA